MRSLAVASLVVLVSMIGVSAGQSADLRVRDRTVYTKKAVPHTRAWRHYRYWCPDQYSCYPLYGAYGPYGGRAYWRAYTSYLR